jgi:benzodiazapine receptor
MKTDTTLARSFIGYVVTLLFFSIGAITTLGLNWYSSLILPAWTPPELLIAFVWIILFSCLGLSVSIFWETSTRNEASFAAVISLYMTNAMLVLLWNYLFFGVHNLGIAFGSAIAVGASIGVLMMKLWKESRTASLLLTPYLLWMVFALYFTYSVLILNP